MGVREKVPSSVTFFLLREKGGWGGVAAHTPFLLVLAGQALRIGHDLIVLLGTNMARSSSPQLARGIYLLCTFHRRFLPFFSFRKCYSWEATLFTPRKRRLP